MQSSKTFSAMKNTKAFREHTEREELRKAREAAKKKRREDRKGKRADLIMWAEG